MLCNQNEIIMSNYDQIQIFGDKSIRTLWDEKQEKWYFSIVDIVAALTDSVDAKRYWSVLKIRIKKEGCEPTTICSTLKMRASDGKMRLTDVADQEGMFRLIQSIPSPKAEPVKQWIAKVASERIDETVDPELAVRRAIETYRKHGYNDAWIKERIEQIEERKALTDEWKRVGIEELQYGILTNEIYQAISDMNAKQYKVYKGLKGKQNLRDNMTETENALTRIGEIATREISQNEDPKTFEHSKDIAKRGGGVARAARNELEKQLGRSVISKQNAVGMKQPRQIDDQTNKP